MNCPKCNGTGILPHYDHRENGKCYQCHGTGIVADTKQNIECLELQERRNKAAKDILDLAKKIIRITTLKVTKNGDIYTVYNGQKRLFTLNRTKTALKYTNTEELIQPYLK